MFGGPRDSAWTHIRVEGGSKEEAIGFLPAARKLLAAVKGTAATNKLGVLQFRQPIAGGGELTARMIGAIPRVTIKLPRFPPKDDDRVILDGFVCWPRNLAQPKGAGDIETDSFDYPQMVLSPPSKKARQRKWWTFLYERYETFWQAVTGSKQVYKTRGPEPLLPAGLRQYGNHIWRGAKGEILSWHGPESGAIVNGVEAFIFLNDDPAQVFDYPQAFYGSKVYHFGRVLVDVSAFPSTTRLYVGGACIREDEATGQTWLYVAQWEGVDPATFFRAFSVYRYKLSRGTERPGFFEPTVDVLDPEVRELVFSATLPTLDPEFGRAWQHPIRFNQSGTKLVVYVPAGAPYRTGTVFTTTGETFPWPGGPTPPTPNFTYLAAYAYRPRDARVTYDVDTGVATTAYLQLFTNTLGAAAIAGDFRGDELVEVKVEVSNAGAQPAYAPFGSASAGSYVLGGQRIPIALQFIDTGAAVRRDIVALAPGDGRALFLRTDLLQPPAATQRTCALELWSENGKVAEWDLGAFDGSALGTGNALGLQIDFGAADYRQFVERPFDSPYMRTPGLTAYGASGAVDPYPASAVIAPIRAVETLSVSPFTSNAQLSLKHAETIFNPYPATGYQPFLPAATHRVRYTTNWRNSLVSGAFLYTAANGAFHGDRPDNDKKLSTRALAVYNETTLSAFAQPAQPDESVTRFFPDADAGVLTGFAGPGFRLHPAVPFGTPIFRTN